MTDPASYLAIDPGRRCGWASCLRGGANVQFGTWQFKQSDPGAVYSAFLGNLKRKLDELPDCQVGMEKLTAVVHSDDKGRGSINIDQVEFSAGFPTHARTLLHRMSQRPLEDIPIPTWRSKTHGFTTAPKGYEGSSSSFLKKKAFEYCEAEGWNPANDNEAEALCILSYVRILFEPGFAFDKGKSFQQEALAL